MDDAETSDKFSRKMIRSDEAKGSVLTWRRFDNSRSPTRRPRIESKNYNVSWKEKERTNAVYH